MGRELMLTMPATRLATTVNIEPNGTHFLKAFCTEESAPVSGVVTIAFNRKAPTT